MYCHKCGNEIREDKFCSYCGANLTFEKVASDTGKENLRKSHIKNGVLNEMLDKLKRKLKNIGINESCANLLRASNKNKVTFIICISFITFLILALISSINSPVKKMDKAISNGDSAKVQEIYFSLSDQEKKEMNKQLPNWATEVIGQYNEGVYSFEQAKELVMIFCNLNSDVSVTSCYDDLMLLNNSKIAYKTAEEYEKAGSYREAITNYKMVSEEDYLYADAQEKLRTLFNAYNESIIQIVDKQMDSYEYEDALEVLNDYIVFIIGKEQNLAELIHNQEDNSELKDILSKLQQLCDSAMAHYEKSATEYEQEEDFLAAIDDLEKGKIFALIEPTKYDARIEDLYDKYFNSYLMKAEEVFINPTTDYEKAAAILEHVKKSYPDETAINEKYDYYLSFTPISLFDMEAYDKSLYFPNEQNDVTDSQGNIHKNAYLCGAIYSGSAYWKLNKNYNVLTGVVGVPDNDADIGAGGEVMIYGDGNLLWEKTDIDGATQPLEISIDITDVDVLNIYIEGGCEPLTFATVMLADLEVQKTQK